MKSIFIAIRDIAQRHPDWDLVYPVHLNPNVHVPAKKILANIPNVHLIDPLPYEPFIFLMNRASLILTDSGGIQEEAPSLGKPVIVMRETTERQEALRTGTVILAGNGGDGLRVAVETILANSHGHNKRLMGKNPYGDGSATKKILDVLTDKFDLE